MEQIILFVILFVILLLCIYYYRNIYEHFDDDNIVKFTLSNIDKNKFLNYKGVTNCGTSSTCYTKLSFDTSGTIFQTTQKDISNGSFPLMIDSEYLQFRNNEYKLKSTTSSSKNLIYNVSTKSVKQGNEYISGSYNMLTSSENNPIYLQMNI